MPSLSLPRRACARPLVIVALCAAMAGVVPAPASAQAPADADRIGQRDAVQRGVEIRGNQRIEAATILAYMNIRPDQEITGADLNDAVRRLFGTGLFRDVQIVPADGRLVVVVEENPIISEIAFEGNGALSDEDLTQIVSLRPRLPFTASAAEQDAAAIIEVYRRTGRYGARVEPKIIERSDNRVDLVFEIDEGESTGVASIDFVGNEVYSDRRLKRVIETDESGFLSLILSTDIYDPDRLELDKELLRQFYLSRGYADFAVLSATAELTPDREGFLITFVVEEGEQYTFGNLDVQVNRRGLDPDAFRALIPDLTGDTYDAGEVEDISDEMKDLAGQNGFAFVTVSPRANKNTTDRIIDVTFELNEGERIFVERIDINGNDRTLDRVIRREVDLVEGDAFDSQKIRDARTNIRALDFFETVEIDVAEGSAPDRAVLDVDVVEKSTGSLSFGIGFASDAGPIGNVAVSERNFLGRGQRLNAQVTAAGDTQVYDFSFTEPKFLDRDLELGARGFFLQDDRTDESSFQVNEAGISLFSGFPLSEDTRIRPRYSFQHDDISSDGRSSPAIEADVGTNISSAVGYRLTHDKRNDRIEPTSGYLLSLDQEVAGVGGDSQYVKTVGSAKGWLSFFDELVVSSLELRGGSLNTFGQDSRVTERFFLGGDSLRGFSSQGIGPRDLNTDDTVGGNYFAVARLETSFPLGLPEELGVFGGAFVDAGTVWGLDRTAFDATPEAPAVDIDDGADLRVSAGGLLFVATPFGPFELSVGFPIIKEDFDDDEVFRFTIGTRF